MTKRKEIEEQLNYFLNMCPKPFSWEKKKRKRAFFDGKLRGPFLARVALKSYWKKKIHANQFVRCRHSKR